MNGTMPLVIGRIIRTQIIGGPYRQRPEGTVGVKMAVEIDAPCDISIPVRDFGVPPPDLFAVGLGRGLWEVMQNRTLYVGCMGGIGRTGLYMAGLAKTMAEYRRRNKRRTFDPVRYVRAHYIPHAVETRQQMRYIDDFPVMDLVEWCIETQRYMGKGGFTPPKGDVPF